MICRKWSVQQTSHPQGYLPDPGIKPMSLMSPALAGGSLPLAPPGKPSNPKDTYYQYKI